MGGGSLGYPNNRDRNISKFKYEALLFVNDNQYTHVEHRTSQPDENSLATFLSSICLAVGKSSGLKRAIDLGLLKAKVVLTEILPNGLGEFGRDDPSIRPAYSVLRSMGAEVVPITQDDFVYDS